MRARFVRHAPSEHDPRRRTAVVDIRAAFTDARHLSLQVALLVTFLASLIGVSNGFRMTRLPDPKPSSIEEMIL
jgi:ABC-type spermidine/putrescine transport system permease subunit II